MADTVIANTTWHNFPAKLLESERMRVVIIPELGGKIVSLFDSIHQFEWLVPPMRALKQNTYGDIFIDQDMSGWDEMLPTIVACNYLDARLPDHGEVWSRPWKIDSEAGSLRLSIDGVQLPYRFSRSAALIAPNCLKLGYTLLNTGKDAIPYLWAAHPQFRVNENTRLVLPAEVTKVINVIANDPLMGEEGQHYSWPTARAVDGQSVQLDRVGPASNQTCRKFYLPPEVHITSATLLQEDQGNQMQMSWTAEEIPYLGVWIDEGSFNAVPVAALEPSNGYYDSLVNAVDNKRVPFILPGKKKNWQLYIRLA